MPRTLHRAKKEKSPISKILGFIAAVLVAAFVFQNRNVFFPWWFPKGPANQPPDYKEQQTESHPDVRKWAPNAGNPLEGDAPNARPRGPSTLSCEEVTARLSGFFQHLDKRDYILAFELEKGSKRYLNDIATKLRGDRPNQAPPLGDQQALFRNLTHFFRVLGPDGIIFLKNILVRERGDIEDIFGLFYALTTFSGCPGAEDIGFHIPLRDLAEYSAFFLNTTGGQAYVFRRDPTVRFLVRYYSLLLLDRAMDMGLYANGAGIGRQATPLLQEAPSTQGLAYRDEYIEILTGLQEKYGK